MLYYLSFAFSSFLAAILLKRHDVVFTSSPPIFHAYTAMIAAKIKKSKFALDIRDIWPDAATEVEAITNKRLLKYGGFIESKIYRYAQIIFTTTKGFKKLIEDRGGKGKTFISYNGSLEEIITWKGDVQKFRQSKGWVGKTVIVYAGLIGLGQFLSGLLLEISKISWHDLLFVFIGDGPKKYEFKKSIKDLNLDNIQVVDALPIKDVIPYLHCSDILMVSLIESEFFKIVIPSKFFDYMAATKPIISNVDGELRQIMEKYNTGLYFSLQEPGSFRNAVDSLINNPEKRQIMGENGKKLVASKFLRSKLAAEAIQHIEKVVCD